MKRLTKFIATLKLRYENRDREKERLIREFNCAGEHVCDVFRSCNKWDYNVPDVAYRNTYDWALRCLTTRVSNIVDNYPNTYAKMNDTFYEYSGRLKEIALHNNYPMDFSY